MRCTSSRYVEHADSVEEQQQRRGGVIRTVRGGVLAGGVLAQRNWSARTSGPGIEQEKSIMSNHRVSARLLFSQVLLVLREVWALASPLDDVPTICR